MRLSLSDLPYGGAGGIDADTRLRRGWSALHFREGNRKQCRKGLVANNEIVCHITSTAINTDDGEPQALTCNRAHVVKSGTTNTMAT